MLSMREHLSGRSVDEEPFLFPDDREQEPPSPPSPGTGLVWVIELDGGAFWHASWQGDDGYAVFDATSRDEVLAWARAQPALGVMLSEGGQTHVRLD
jgi:hypothetical protein